jgi:uncharacterized protein YaaW (UPF0174 family)
MDTDTDHSLGNVLYAWRQDELSNLSAILELDPQHPSVEAIEEQIKWLYYSRTRAQIKSSISNTADRVRSLFDKVERASRVADQEYPVPSYSQLVFGLAEKLKVDEKDASLEQSEEAISHEVIVQALTKMSPGQRRTFFNEAIDLGEVLEAANARSGGLLGPKTTVQALQSTRPRAMSLYVASSTALGFMTHAMGMALPFAAIKGLGATVAFVIGPVGWLAAGGWAAWLATGPEWRKLLPAILYITATNSYSNIVNVSNSQLETLE